ncbi:MAG: NTP transferase domain-containing protein [Pseudomonadota bacterium]|nr:NTP transferase domain-containing protein [Pseudomonadota bacterium]
MIPLEQCAALLLCAGLSQRFGPDNKLLAPLGGRPLAAHAAALCRDLPFATRLAVVPPSEPELSALLLDHGFELLPNPTPEAGKDSSLRIGLARALDLPVRGMMVLLGDMPHVGPAHLIALAAAADDERAAISSADGIISPPTLIPADAARLAIDRTDQPVRASLGNPVPVTAPAEMLVDYDIPKQFHVDAGQRGNPGQPNSSEDL